MNNAIIVSYDPFARESRVSIVAENSKTQVNVCSSLEELTVELIKLSYGHDIYEIKLHAPPAIIEEIEGRITKAERNIYAVNRINIEEI